MQPLIVNRIGEPVRRSSFGHCWERAVASVGLPKGTRFHDLRHYFASVLIAAGHNPQGHPGADGDIPRSRRRWTPTAT